MAAADLSKANLTGATLRNVSVAGARLPSANFDGAEGWRIRRKAISGAASRAMGAKKHRNHPDLSELVAFGVRRTSVMALRDTAVTSMIQSAISTRSPADSGIRESATRTKPAMVV